MPASAPIPQIEKVARSTASYDDFPYLLTRITPAFYHVIPLSDVLDEDALRSLARSQYQRNQLPTCLVFTSQSCVYFDLHGTESDSDHIPSGGIFASQRLKPCAPLENTTWWKEKTERLNDFVQHWNALRGRYVLGDLTKGGRPATEDERQRYTGTSPDGKPNGLARCRTCSEWKGECLDPNPRFPHNIIPVSCRCENTHQCARCLKPLADRKLNANYLDEESGDIIHVPGFVAFSHVCRRKWLRIAVTEGSRQGQVIGEWEE